MRFHSFLIHPAVRHGGGCSFGTSGSLFGPIRSRLRGFFRPAFRRSFFPLFDILRFAAHTELLIALGSGERQNLQRRDRYDGRLFPRTQVTDPLITVQKIIDGGGDSFHPGSGIRFIDEGIETAELFPRMIGEIADIAQMIVGEEQLFQRLPVVADAERTNLLRILCVQLRNPDAGITQLVRVRVVG